MKNFSPINSRPLRSSKKESRLRCALRAPKSEESEASLFDTRLEPPGSAGRSRDRAKRDPETPRRVIAWSRRLAVVSLHTHLINHQGNVAGRDYNECSPFHPRGPIHRDSHPVAPQPSRRSGRCRRPRTSRCTPVSFRPAAGGSLLRTTVPMKNTTHNTSGTDSPTVKPKKIEARAARRDPEEILASLFGTRSEPIGFWWSLGIEQSEILRLHKGR
jgi:hypothetical protein